MAHLYGAAAVVRLRLQEADSLSHLVGQRFILVVGEQDADKGRVVRPDEGDVAVESAAETRAPVAAPLRGRDAGAAERQRDELRSHRGSVTDTGPGTAREGCYRGCPRRLYTGM